ncbi:AAA family ATPase [Fusobacterium sp.]|jgi:phage transposase|uniref:Transposase n=1 Tax=Fusobacterium nucleatum TaxID=851 RepID=A0A323U9U5_FUSNU|nr:MULTISPECIES: AAA family ATPase [Fusobacterium]DAW70584.1 MAG TPA: putative ATPase [Caudoviricetes sp.]PCR85671.1 transposase [Fusobacterium nucleatum]PZA04548.1 transposase [Fusobacterium nucleatum]QJX49617.1 AAA family ATPase [Fusobacterium nucleatum]HCE32917.1 transposase [Fusobacterium sp.]
MDDLRTRLEIFSEDNNMSFTKIAKAMGVGASTLSEWRKGTYSGDNEAFSEKVSDFLDRHKRKIKRINFSVNTETKKRVFHVLNTIKKYVSSNITEGIIESSKIGYIYGRAGLGKTHALQEWLKTYGGRGVLITAENGISSVGLIKKIAKELKLDTSGSSETLKDRIKDAIKLTETIIIIDEGEHLKANVIDIVRSIADQTGVGVVIAGTEVLKSKILSRKKEYEYLYSRAVVNISLKDLAIDDVSNIVKEFLKNEIELYKETELQTLISYINIVVRGSARNLANVLTSSYEIALQNNSLKIEKKYIDAALSTLAL